MGRRGRKAAAIAAVSEPTAAREALERRWRDRLSVEPRPALDKSRGFAATGRGASAICQGLATLVTAEGARREALHRWLPYKQGFSPGLVRLFLAENPRTPKHWASHPVLDPFAGSGTCVVECARHGVRAVGVDAIPALVFLANAKFEREFPPLPDASGASMWQEVADRLCLPIHRAALMLAVGRQHTTAGRANRGARPLGVALDEVAKMMRDDLSHPLASANRIEVGDARRLTMIEDGAIGGILTSPPYLSRHDYTRIADPYEMVYRYWYGGQGCHCCVSSGVSNTNHTAHRAVAHGGAEQVRASLRGRGEGDPSSTVAAAEEAAEWLGKIGQEKLASVVRGYLEDVALVLHECHRVLEPRSVCWMVIGGARIKDVYVPSDLIVAELAEGCGFRVEAIRVARDLVGSPRKFGRLGHVAPRESLLVMSRG
ncbi:MAG: hypothetical protein V1790_12450 [Planctomycetota bacterium]